MRKYAIWQQFEPVNLIIFINCIMKYIIEFYYQGEAIESREYDDFFIEPHIGDVLIIHFTNPSYNEYGKWWIVNERRIIFFSEQIQTLRQTLMVNISPDPKNGLWKSDPLYKNFER